jgi:hypothetical protein
MRAVIIGKILWWGIILVPAILWLHPWILLVALLQSKGCSVVALQEVKQDYFAALKRHPGIVAAAYSLAVRPPAAGTPAKRLLGCAIVVLDASVEIGDAALIETSICPERTLVADATVGGHRVLAASLHCPNGSNWGNDKAVWFHEVANWLCEQTLPTIFGIDANTPKNEGLDDTSYAKWWHEDSHPAVGNGALKLVGDGQRTPQPLGPEPRIARDDRHQPPLQPGVREERRVDEARRLFVVRDGPRAATDQRLRLGTFERVEPLRQLVRRRVAFPSRSTISRERTPKPRVGC